MTADELDALPVYKQFGSERYDVQADGTVTLPNGQVLRGLIGKYITVPRQQDELRCMHLDSLHIWRDKNGKVWRTVMTQDGMKKAPE